MHHTNYTINAKTNNKQVNPLQQTMRSIYVDSLIQLPAKSIAKAFGQTSPPVTSVRRIGLVTDER